MELAHHHSQFPPPQLLRRLHQELRQDWQFLRVILQRLSHGAHRQMMVAIQLLLTLLQQAMVQHVLQLPQQLAARLLGSPTERVIHLPPRQLMESAQALHLLHHQRQYQLAYQQPQLHSAQLSVMVKSLWRYREEVVTDLQSQRIQSLPSQVA